MTEDHDELDLEAEEVGVDRRGGEAENDPLRVLEAVMSKRAVEAEHSAAIAAMEARIEAIRNPSTAEELGPQTAFQEAIARDAMSSVDFLSFVDEARANRADFAAAEAARLAREGPPGPPLTGDGDEPLTRSSYDYSRAEFAAIVANDPEPPSSRWSAIEWRAELRKWTAEA